MLPSQSSLSSLLIRISTLLVGLNRLLRKKMIQEVTFHIISYELKLISGALGFSEVHRPDDNTNENITDISRLGTDRLYEQAQAIESIKEGFVY